MLYKLDNCCFIEVARDSKTRISRSPPPNDYEYSNRVIISPAVYYQSCSNIRLDESDRSSLYLDPFYRHFFKSFYIISDSSVPSHSIFTLTLMQLVNLSVSLSRFRILFRMIFPNPRFISYPRSGEAKLLESVAVAARG